MTSIPPLYEHQTVSIQTFLSTPIGLDASDPGTGKTRVQIELFAQRRKTGSKCALVIAPKSLLDSAWKAEFKKYAPHLKVQVCPAKDRDKAFNTDADVYVTNTDAAVWLAKQKPEFFLKFDTLIVDESSAFKHATSLRSRALKKIAPNFQYRYLLSGTPMSNEITDIWHQIFVLDNGKRLGKSFYQFRASVCSPIQVGPHPVLLKWQPRPGAELAITNLIRDITVRNKFEECLDIPPNHTYTIDYRMGTEQAKAYTDMEKYALTEMGSGRTITAVNAAVVMGKLLQIASGSVYSDYGTGNSILQIKAADALGYTPIEEARYEMIADLIEARPHVLVFFNWVHQRDMLIKALKRRNITHCVIDGSINGKTRAENVEHFQAGFYRVMLAHPASAAHGLTLTRATTTIWTGPPLNLEHFLQGNRRIYRSGQTKSTETILVLAIGTIEETVYKRLQDKDALQTSALNFLQSHFKDKS
jgi:SNF2 family DNA or RNA helicase